MMTSRERVRHALAFESPDQALRELWALPGVQMFRRGELDALLARYPSDLAAPDVTHGASPDVKYGTDCRTRGTPTLVGSYVDEWGCPFTVAEDSVIGYCAMIQAAGKAVFFHSDGHIRAIIPDLIEIGVDAFNAQLFCMDIEEIGRTFKRQITFWGEIDRQWVLPFGTTQDVQQAVQRVRAALDDGRGGIIAQCEWGNDVSVENVEAIFATWTMPL